MKKLDHQFWDRYWQGISLPIEIKENTSTPYIRELLNIFKRYLPRDKGLRALEIGAAPGGYLAYLARTFGYSVSALDYSHVGCKKIKENFHILNIPVKVWQIDILHDKLTGLPQFDIVYSLGVIEHFCDPFPVIQKHIQLAKSKGLIVIGTPNFLGINKVFLRLFNPKYLMTHNLTMMDLNRWRLFEEKYGLERVFRGYIGGWEPRIYKSEIKQKTSAAYNIFFRGIAYYLDQWPILRRFNSKWWSGYAVGIFRKGTSSQGKQG
jgi:2-polyprenyl-3-methyl-5-hydroxy-6-metoxy-1,4-benzoquinol methylase